MTGRLETCVVMYCGRLQSPRPATKSGGEDTGGASVVGGRKTHEAGRRMQRAEHESGEGAERHVGAAAAPKPEPNGRRLGGNVILCRDIRPRHLSSSRRVMSSVVQDLFPLTTSTLAR